MFCYLMVKRRELTNGLCLLLAALVQSGKQLYLPVTNTKCLTYLRFPKAHWKVIRTSNLIERTFGDGRRRTKVIPRFPTETAGLRLLWQLCHANNSFANLERRQDAPDIWFEIELLRREAFGELSQMIEKELVAG